MKKGITIGRKLCAVMLSLMLLLSLSACQDQSKSASSSDAAGTRKEHVLTDQAGRSVKIPAEVKRIVSGYYISTSACIALELDDRLAGIEAKADSRPIYRLAAPELLTLPNVGTAKEFDMEACIALEPDLVILPKRLKDVAETMSSMDIAVILVSPESTDELLEMIALIAEATGTSERAETVTARYTESVSSMEKLVQGVMERPAVYMGANHSHLSTAPGSMYQSELIERSGGKNVAAPLEGDNWTEVSYEQLLTFNPDYILIPSEAAYGREDVLKDAQLGKLAAVQKAQVFEMPDALEAWDAPTMSGALGMAWTVHVLHPELYPLEALQKDAAAYYADIYGIEVDAASIGA